MLTQRLLRTWLLLLLLVAVSPLQVRAQKDARELTIAFYNVENFFDLEDDPAFEDEEYLPTGEKQWNAEKYQKKLQEIRRVLSAIPPEGKLPAMLGMCEVETAAVARDIVEQLPGGENYRVVLIDSRYHRGVDVALAYDPSLLKHIRSVAYPTRPIAEHPDWYSRDILQVDGVLPSGDTLSVFVNHWPSRRNEESARIAVASKLRAVIDSIRNESPQRGILVMGDLNDEPHNMSVKDYLSEGGAAENAPEQRLYNLMGLPAGDPDLGTYCYHGNWNMLDNMLISLNMLPQSKTFGLRAEREEGVVFNPEFVQQQGGDYDGYPNRTFAGRKYLAGPSDHFAIYARFILYTE